MPAYATLDGLTYRTPDGRTLFQDLTLAFGAERTGLVGRNGVGKTTLLRLITGELTPSAGAVAVNGRLGVLRQALAPAPGETVADLLGAAGSLRRLARIAAGEAGEADLAEADWTLESRLEAALDRVDLGGLSFDRPAGELSGGQVTRARLAGVLAAAPDLLILDEPTNNLDAPARAVIAELLAGWRGGAIVVSHDRSLLRRMDRIVELSGLGVAVHGGDYDAYVAARGQAETAARQDLAVAEREVARAARDAQVARERQARRDAAGRRARARGDAPKILLDARAERAERTAGRGAHLAGRLGDAARAELEAARARVEVAGALAFALPPSGLPAGRTVLTLEDVGFSFAGGPPLIAGLDLQIVGPERIALTGANGSGKSTLLRLIAGELAPSAGRLSLAVPAAALDQQAAVLRPDETLVENFRRLNPGADANRAHAALARFLFRNLAAQRRAGELSAGERLRAALACVLMGERPPQLLLLDEPTNHLDLDSIAAIEAALADYDGALLVASHDPDFLEAVGTDRVLDLG